MPESCQQIRLINLSFADGARQLAVSEAIMLAVGQRLAPPTLRLYSWSEPVVIIGVGQPASDLDLDYCRQRGYRVLRRIGGGTAVYHDEDEVSIDLIVPAGGPLGPTDVHAGYRLFAGLLQEALTRLGIDTEVIDIESARSLGNDEIMRPLCFASVSPYEFLSGGRKLNGLCQIRRRDAIAYQSAIYNRFQSEPLLASLVHENELTRQRRNEKIDHFVTDMTTVRGEPVDYAQLQLELADVAARRLNLSATPGLLTDFEIAETEQLISEKYANNDWTFRR